MKLGYSITSAFSPDTPPQTAAKGVLERAGVAHDAGFDYVEAGDHHAVAPGGYLQNVPITARLSAVFDHVATMFLLPLYHPVLVAEQAGTIAALVDEFDFWCAVGGGHQFDAMGISQSERGRRFEEALTLISQLWNESSVTFDGEFYQTEAVSINPTAAPRICIGGHAEPAVRRAGQLGDAWVPGPSVMPGDLRRQREWYTEAGGEVVIARREALVLEDGDEARRRVHELLDEGYRGWPRDAGWILTGDADAVANQLGELRDLGVDEVVIRPMSGAAAAETFREVARARDRI